MHFNKGSVGSWNKKVSTFEIFDCVELMSCTLPIDKLFKLMQGSYKNGYYANIKYSKQPSVNIVMFMRA